MTTDQIITLASVILASIGTASGWIYTFFNDRKKAKSDKEQETHRLSVQYITDKRVDWIYEVRNTLSDFVACAEEILIGFNGITGDKLESALSHKIWSDYYKLRLLFNYKDAPDRKIMEELEKIMKYLFGDIEFDAGIEFRYPEGKENDIKYGIDVVVGLSQKYLKNEWDRVKRETAG